MNLIQSQEILKDKTFFSVGGRKGNHRNLSTRRFQHAVTGYVGEEAT